MIQQPQLGNIIRYHRKKAGLSQSQLAQMVGVGKTVIFDLEKGKETGQLDTLNKILYGLNIKVKLESGFMKSFDAEKQNDE